ncbi:MAG TPA: hypothetical protein VL588_10820 [Bdellovibrionota bacterium]|jgi:hypothetical protein|nr:hypothetical protein [Bdellovibrionota bacterium]
MKHRLLAAAALSLFFAAQAQAGYYRFWRGYKRADLSEQQLVDGLNARLIPATGALAQSDAHLTSYQPVVPEATLQARYGLPHEVALVEYQDEASYLKFRATPLGQAYGDMHWELFGKDVSKSAVPEKYVGTVTTGKAYEVVESADWNLTQNEFRVYPRAEGSTDGDYLAGVRAHVETVRAGGPAGLIVLVDPAYVLEYVGWPEGAAHAGSEGAVIDTPLAAGSAVTEGAGIVYDLTP